MKNDLCRHYCHHIVYGKFCIHVPHWNDFGKQSLSWLRVSRHTSLFRFKARDLRHYSLNWRLCVFFTLLKHSKLRARHRRWSNEYVLNSMTSCNWRYIGNPRPLPKLHKCDRGGRDKESVSIHQCSQLTVRAAATTPSTHTLKPWRRIDKRQTPKTYRSVLGQYLPSNAKCKRQPLACLC